MQHLLEQLLDRAYRFAVRMCGDRDTAEEVVQEAMLRAWRRRDDLRDDRKAAVWLLSIVANVWRDRLRRRAENESIDEARLLDSQPSVESSVVAREELRRAVRLMDQLPDRQRQVLYLHACEDLSLAEIAEVLEISHSAVKSSLAVARKRMRQLHSQRETNNDEPEPCGRRDS